MDCQICFSTLYDPKLSCYCNFNSCTGCFEKWIISGATKDPSCPNCKRNLSQEYIYQSLSPSFLATEYKNWRQNFLAIREKIYFANDFDRVRIEKQRRQSRKQLLELYKKKKKLLKKRIDCTDINMQITALKKDMPKSIFNRAEILVKSEPKYYEYVIPCPDDCRGLIRKKDYACTLCEVKVCKDCLTEAHPEKCKKEDIESAKNILNNTKSCPKCAVRIHKIHGCDQMWCVMCHSTFSWETGMLMTDSVVHNPHYFEWYFGNNDEPAQNPCIDLRMELRKDKFTGRPEYYYITQFYRLILHIDHVVLFDLRADHYTNQDLRYKYLLKEINDNVFARILYKREFRNLKRLAMYDLYNSYNLIAKDILSSYIQDQNFKDFCDSFMKLYTDYKNYARKIISTYKGRIKHFQTIGIYFSLFENFIRNQ